MVSKEMLEELVSIVDPFGFPNCKQDADKALRAVRFETNGHVVWYKGNIVYFDGIGFRSTRYHAVAHTDSGHIIDVALPIGKRVYGSAAEYWEKSLNTIRKLENG